MVDHPHEPGEDHDDFEDPDELEDPDAWSIRYTRLHLTNFLSYRDATLDFGDLVALVGPNASGKSNAVAAMKLLREIPTHGLATAIARRGGFDQLRHRSSGRPYNPAMRLDFAIGGRGESFYEISLRAIEGKRYEVKSEYGVVETIHGRSTFHSRNGRLEFEETIEGETWTSRDLVEHDLPVAPGQSAIAGAPSSAAYQVRRALEGIQTVEINPARVADLQEPSSTGQFEPDGSNTVSLYETLDSHARQELVDGLSAIVPGIERVDVRRLADRLTLMFFQRTGHGRREFYAKQMSDGTLRAFSILLSMLQPEPPRLLVIEEPEIAIHLGALRTLVDILQQESVRTQILLTTHSADIIDTLGPDALRVVWSSDGESHISHVAEHSLSPIREGLITPGEMLRADALDPA